ncbi:MAG: HAD family hydrolase [Aquihabitans sp.]
MSTSHPISLVVTDLDGTVWQTDDQIPDVVISAIGELKRREIPLLVATGRRLASARDPFARIGIALPSVVLNGALGVDLTDGSRFHRAPFTTEEATAVLAGFRSVGLAPVIYVDNPRFDVFLDPNPSTNPGHITTLGATAATDDLSRVVAEEAVLGFSMIGVPHRDGAAAEEAVGPIAEVHLDRSLDYDDRASFTVAPRGQSKWDGVLAYCAVHGLDANQVLALADGPNDLELLDEAAVSLVPEVAHPEALARADHIIPPAADGGWAAVLDHLP